MTLNDETLGAIFVGSFVATMLFGVACIQTWLYFQRSQKDRLMFKITVLVIVVFNTTQVIAQSYLLYLRFVTNFGNTAMAQMSSIPSCLQVAIASVNDLIVRSFLARRVYIVCGPKKKYMGMGFSGFIFAVSLTVCALSLVYNTISYIIGIRPLSPERMAALLSYTYLLYTMYSLSAVADLTIAASLSGLLWKKKTGFKKTDDLVAFWVLFSIQTGVVTSVFAILALVLLATHPDSLYSLGVYYVLTQLHVNSLLASLNVRGAFRTNVTYNTTDANLDDHISLGPSGSNSSPSLKMNLAKRMTFGNLLGSAGRGERSSKGLYEVEVPLSRKSSAHSKQLVIGKEEVVAVYADDGKAVEL